MRKISFDTHFTAYLLFFLFLIYVMLFFIESHLFVHKKQTLVRFELFQLHSTVIVLILVLKKLTVRTADSFANFGFCQ